MLRKKNIFVPVNLKNILYEINNNNFKIELKTLQKSQLRPSIETLLHAIMPHKIVAHIHAIESLAHLVRKNCPFESFLQTEIPHVIIDYFKPGEKLAEEIFFKRKQGLNPDVVFMKNHGIVVGGKDTEEVNAKIKKVETFFFTSPVKNIPIELENKRIITLQKIEYKILNDLKIQQLVFNKNILKRLKKDWALYPDHVVFLGKFPYIFNEKEDIIFQKGQEIPEIIFVKNEGIFANSNFSKIKLEQLYCYYNVISPSTTRRAFKYTL